MKRSFIHDTTRSTRWVALLFGVVIAFSACRKPDDDLGLSLLPSDPLGVIEDTTTLHAYTFVDTVIRTSGLTRNLLGSYLDPDFGYSKASIVTQLRLSSNNVGDGSDNTALTADSIVLSLAFDGINYAYGNLDAQTFEVYEVTSDLYVDSLYYMDNVPEIASEDLCASHACILTPDPFNYAHVGGDSLLPQLRIRLKNELAERFLNAFGTDDLNDTESFLSFFKGLYITVNNGQQIPFQQGLLYLSLINGASKVVTYYKDGNNEPDVQRQFELLINSNALRYTVFEHDHAQATNPGLANALADTVSPSYTTYAQTFAGARTAIRFPYLMNYAGNGRILAKAELIIPVEGTFNGYLPPPNKLEIFRRSEEGKYLYLTDQFSSIVGIDGKYRATEREYRFAITRYVQRVLTGEVPNDGLYVITDLDGITGNRVILSGPAKETNGMRLNLTFTTY